MCPNFSELLFPVLQNGNIYLYLCPQISLKDIIINTKLAFTAPHKCPLLGEGIAVVLKKHWFVWLLEME